MRRKWLLPVLACLLLSYASTVSAAMTLRRVGVSPFYRPPLKSVADLKTLVKTREADLKVGFIKAGQLDLYSDFMQQFPNADIEKTTVQPGETMQWMLYKKKKGMGPVGAAKDVTWGGKAPLDVYRFSINHEGVKYTFVVPGKCGNVALLDVKVIPPPPKPLAPPPPPPKTVEKPVTMVPKKGVFLADIGYARQTDPGNYMFGRVGYGYPIANNLYIVGMIGTYGNLSGDGDTAFIADAMLEYHWTRVYAGIGTGYWSAYGGKMDVMADLGYRLSTDENSFLSKTSVFVEGRSLIDKNKDAPRGGQMGVGVRFTF
jgi:hypothetical protein